MKHSKAALHYCWRRPNDPEHRCSPLENDLLITITNEQINKLVFLLQHWSLLLSLMLVNYNAYPNDSFGGKISDLNDFGILLVNTSGTKSSQDMFIRMENFSKNT